MPKRQLEQAEAANLTNSTASGGRAFQRQFAHVEGNWPSHVYLSVGTQQQLSVFSRACVRQFLTEGMCGEAGVNVIQEDRSSLHVSLSKPFVLRHHQIQPFLRILHRALLTCPELPIALEIYAEYIILSNESRSRSFICIPIEDRLKSLEAVVTRGVNVAVADMRQPLYHEKPKFHISPRLADMGAATTDDQTGATTASSSVAGEGSDKVYAVDRKFIVEVRKQIRDEDSGAESDSGDSDSDGDDSEGVAAKYCGSAQLSLDCIECKIGNMTYRFDKSKGFVECS